MVTGTALAKRTGAALIACRMRATASDGLAYAPTWMTQLVGLKASLSASSEVERSVVVSTKARSSGPEKAMSRLVSPCGGGAGSGAVTADASTYLVVLVPGRLRGMGVEASLVRVLFMAMALPHARSKIETM